MKKILLSIMVVGALVLTSCKGEKKEEVKTLNEVKTEVKKEVKKINKESKNIIVGVEMPEFSNKVVEANLKLYALNAEKYIRAKGDAVKRATLAKKGKELLDKGRNFVAKLSKDEQDLYAKAMAKIQSKMAPVK